MKTKLRIGMAAAMLVAAASASAHDTWFEPVADPVGKAGAPGSRVLALGTGTEYPLQDTAIGAEYLARQGCRLVDESGKAGSKPAPLQPLGNTPVSLLLRVPAAARTCWAQLTPFEVDLPLDKVAVYFKDIQASPEVRAAWAGMHARGVPWRERYTKHARIELAGPSDATVPMDMDIRIEPGSLPLQPGGTLQAQVLRDGVPLAGQAIQLRSEDSPLGIWRRSDAEGRITVPLPLPGRWVLRGVDLRLSATRPDSWESRFVTLAFEVPKAATKTAETAVVKAEATAEVGADQNGSSFRLNARSTSQVAATAAITSEPPVSTARR